MVVLRPVKEGGIRTRIFVLTLLGLAIASPLFVELSIGVVVQQRADVMGPLQLLVKWSYATGDVHISYPLVADVDGDGWHEILVGSSENGAYCLNGSGFVEWIYLPGGWSYPKAVADFDGDGETETALMVNSSSLYFLSGAGGLKWKLTSLGLRGTLIADIDGDDRSEVLNAGPNQVSCYNFTGGLKWDWFSDEESVSPLVVGDLNQDGYKEVLVSSNFSVVYCLGAFGQQLWNYAVGSKFYACPTIADVDGDGRLEVVVASLNGGVHCLDELGTRKWNTTMSEGVWSAAPLVADLDGDGLVETLIGGSDHVFCLNTSGQLKWSYELSGFGPLSFQVANLDNDSELEVVMDTFEARLTYLGGRGQGQYSFLMPEAIYGHIVVDVDSDGQQEVIVTSFDSIIYCLAIVSEPVVDGWVPLTYPLSVIAIGIFSSFILVAAMAARRRSRSTSVERASGRLEPKSVATQGDLSRSKWRLEPQIPSFGACPTCGAVIDFADSSYCWSCGTPLAIASRNASLQTRGARHERLSSRCMVCSRRVNRSDETVRCPYCGNVAHRTHMLEWLHVKDYCPVCRRHLDSENFR